MTLEDPPRSQDDAADEPAEAEDVRAASEESSDSTSATGGVASVEPSDSTGEDAIDEAEETLETSPEEPSDDTTTEELSGSTEPETDSTEGPEGPSEGTPLVTEEGSEGPQDESAAGGTVAEPSPDGDASVEAAPVAAGADPYGGPGDWYVIHTYAGYENKVKTNLESRIHTMQMQDKVFDVVIPMEDVMEIKGGKKQVVQKKVFPGYLLVKMVYDDDSWYVVRNTPGVTGFVSSGTGQKPTPLSRREVEKILAVKKEEVKPAFRLDFEEGDVVRIISGPFADFNGTISDINVDQSKVRVMVNIFDRETPVELSFDQVARV